MAGGVDERASGVSAEGTTEQGLAVKLEKVVERLSADAPNTQRPGADLIGYYLSPDRLPAAGSGPASTPIPSGGCVSGSLPR